jgi:hypothetical protein
VDLVIDLDIYKWPLRDRIDFERAAGMTVERAASTLASASEDEDLVGAALDVPAVVPAAFVWIAARRDEPGLTFDDAAGRFTGEDFFAAIKSEDEPAPLANRAQKRSTAKSAGPSATTSTTRPRKSST